MTVPIIVMAFTSILIGHKGLDLININLKNLNSSFNKKVLDN